VINSNLCRISHRFGDTATYWSKIANSYPPHPHSTPSLRVTPSNFGMNVISPETRMMGLPYGEKNPDRRSNHVDTVHECDRQTDRRTDRRTELRSQRPCNAERRTVKMEPSEDARHLTSGRKLNLLGKLNGILTERIKTRYSKLSCGRATVRCSVSCENFLQLNLYDTNEKDNL